MDKQKEQAVEWLREFDVCDKFLKQFIENGQVTVFHSNIGRDISEYHSEVQQKIKELEDDHGCLVYAVIHNRFSFGECFSFLIVSKYEEDWDISVQFLDINRYRAFSYVWNKTDDSLSEFGSIIVDAFYGCLQRVY